LQPVDVANFGQVSNLPEILAGLLGLIAVATIGHLLLSSVRRRRRELAVLKTLGLVPRQVSALVAWQATTISVLAAAVGVPIGVAGGRWAWIAVANGLGVVPSPSVPVLLVLGLIPAAAVVANLIAAAPAASAGRVSPATALRAE
jgi:putative ABC transport system permease protein